MGNFTLLLIAPALSICSLYIERQYFALFSSFLLMNLLSVHSEEHSFWTRSRSIFFPTFFTAYVPRSALISSHRQRLFKDKINAVKHCFPRFTHHCCFSPSRLWSSIIRAVTLQPSLRDARCWFYLSFIVAILWFVQRLKHRICSTLNSAEISAKKLEIRTNHP